MVVPRTKNALYFVLAVLLSAGCEVTEPANRQETETINMLKDLRQLAPFEFEVSVPESIDLKEGIYNVPFDATPSQIIEWNKKYNFVVDMQSEADYQSEIEQRLDLFEDLQGEGFWSRDPKTKQLVFSSRIKTSEGRRTLEKRLSNMTFEYSSWGERRQAAALGIRDFLNTLDNPYVVQNDEKYYLRPVFSFREGGIRLYLDEDYDCFDGRIMSNTCWLKLKRERTLNDKDPLMAIWVFFLRIGDEQWKSYGTIAQFTYDCGEVIEALNNKYGQYQIVGTHHHTLKHPADHVKIVYGTVSVEMDGKPVTIWQTIPNEMSMTMYELFDVLPKRDGSQDAYKFWVWRKNIFAFTVHHWAPNDIQVIYYDTKYAHTIIDQHRAGLEECKKETQTKEKEIRKQMEDRF